MVNRVKFMKTYSDVLELLNLGIAYKILFTKPSRLPISYENSVEFPSSAFLSFNFYFVLFRFIWFYSVLF